jgi:hypothetical protein
MRSRLCLAFMALATVTAPAWAADECHLSRVSLCDGCNVTAHWSVKVAPQGSAPNKFFCKADWSSRGGNQQFTLLQAPVLGKVSFHTYRVEYRGNKVGHDTLVVRQTWLSPSNQRWSGTVTYDIDVVAQ